MPTTPRGLPYPAATDPVSSGAANIQALAEAIEKRALPAVSATPPASPVDGQLWAYSPAAGTVWLFRYNASGTTYLWEFVGGPPLLYVDGAETSLMGSAWTTVQPATSLARAGEYLLGGAVSYCRSPTAGNTQQVGVGLGSGSAAAASGLVGQPTANLNIAATVPPVYVTVAAGGQVNFWIHGGAAGAIYGPRTLSILPRRVS